VDAKVAAIIFTVGVCVAGLAAYVALRQYILCDPLTQPFIKNEILAFELNGQILFLCFTAHSIMPPST
jgi:hypothetical protein